MKKLIISALAIVAMVGCQKNDNLDIYDEDSVVRFSSASLDTKLNDAGTLWTKGDVIGITSFSESELSFNYISEPYVADESASSTSFSPAAEANVITYANNYDVSFIAYYPYNDMTASSLQTPLDISDQSDISKLDFMVSDIVTVAWDAANKSTDTEVEFDFKHKLSKIVMNVSARSDSESFETDVISALLGDVYTTASASLDGSLTFTGDATTIELNTQIIDESNAIVTAVVFPAESNTYQIGFVLGDAMISTTFTDEFQEGKQYNYTVKVGNSYANFEGESSVVDWIDDEGEYSASCDYSLGSIYNPQIIATLDDFKKIGSDDGSWSMDSHYKITAPIDFEGDGGNGTPWTPIGKADNNRFTGSIDGGNYPLTGLYISEDSAYAGLFYCVYNATLSNIYIVAPKIESEYNYVGVLSTFIEYCDIINCVIEDPTIETNGYYAGGLAAYSTSSNFYSCSVVGGSLTTTGSCIYAGGIAGYGVSSITMENCSVSMEFSGNMSNLGGLLGHVVFCESTIKECSFTGDITSTYTSYYGIGGLIGHSNSSSAISVVDCEVESTIYCASASRIGGVIGYNECACSIEGTTVGESSAVTANYDAAGFVGYSGGDIYINNCINRGDVTILSSSDSRSSGGFVGQKRESSTACTINNSINEGDVYSYYNSGGFIGLTYAALQVTISNSINRGDIVSSGYTSGGFIGCSKSPLTISNCHNEGDVSSNYDSAGGFIGDINGDEQVITNSSNSGTITTEYYSGGIVGGASYTAGSTLDISYCSNEGEIFCDLGAGGIVGYVAYYDTAISYCSNSGAITKNTELNVTRAGGICGYVDLYEIGDLLVINSSNSGDITSASLAGGLVGFAASTNGDENYVDIVNCYNTGYLDAANMGGLIYNGGPNLNISSSYNIGEIGFSYSGVYAFVYNSSGEVVSAEDCYYSSELVVSDDYAVALSAEYMQSANFATKLSSAAINYNLTGNSRGVEACAWKQGSDGYPTLDF